MYIVILNDAVLFRTPSMAAAFIFADDTSPDCEVLSKVLREDGEKRFEKLCRKMEALRNQSKTVVCETPVNIG